MTPFKAAKVDSIQELDLISRADLADPKQEQPSITERTVMAIKIHRDRCVRPLKFMKPAVATAALFDRLVDANFDQGSEPIEISVNTSAPDVSTRVKRTHTLGGVRKRSFAPSIAEYSLWTLHSSWLINNDHS